MPDEPDPYFFPGWIALLWGVMLFGLFRFYLGLSLGSLFTVVLVFLFGTNSGKAAGLSEEEKILGSFQGKSDCPKGCSPQRTV